MQHVTNTDRIELRSLEHPSGWNNPVLFDECEAPDISAHCLPGILGEFACALAQATETPEALSVMTILGKDFQETIELQLRPDGKLSCCQVWGGKICGFVLRIAGLLHAAEYDANNLTITESTMINALRIAEALVEHAIAALGLIRIDQATQDAKIIYSWIKTRNESTFTQSDVVLAMRNKKLGKSERLVKALHILNERNLISAPIKLLTRKPTTIYYVNPILLAKNK